MDAEAEGRVLRLALERGKLSRTALDRATTLSIRTNRSRLDLLREAKALDATTVEALAEEASAPPGAGADPPVRDWERYRIEGYLGGGGMGRVFRAVDPRLDRTVAIKFIRDAEPQLVERFHREAQAQARVEHDRICKVYEVGEVDGHPYIVMQFVDGVPLDAAATGMTLEQKLLAIREVAEGLHQAHRNGLTHRDIKPGNILVSRTADGRWLPYLMDFGLARWKGSAGITRTGTVIGTPHYMPPEQAAGSTETLDRRSDVYSLGATLYDILLGHPPFTGSSVAVLRQVLDDVPKSLHGVDPTIPRDVDAITMKCLRKNPAERYPSARALAEDLTRYLDGEPVQARPTTAWYRLRVKAARHRVAFALGGAAVALLALTAGWGLYERWTLSRRTRLAQEFGQQVERIEALTRYSHTLPLHDVRPERERIRDRMEHIRTRMDTIGSLARGPGHYALGRGYLVQDAFTEAREHLETAWESGYRDPAVAYALGRTLGGLYREALRTAEMMADREMREARLGEIERDFRDPALEFLRQSRGAEGEPQEFVEALLAAYERRHDDALRKARSARERIPWLYEARQLEGDIHISRAADSSDQGDSGAAMQALQEAKAAYEDALSIGRSDPGLHAGACRIAALMVISGGDGPAGTVRGYFEDGLAACDRALTADPGHAEARVERASLFSNMGEQAGRRGDDPRNLLSRAVDEARLALEIRPGQARAHDQIGKAFLLRARHEQERGEDPRASLDEAARAFRAAIDSLPATSRFNDLGLVYKTLALYQMQRGDDPRDSLGKAIESYQAALRITPALLGPNVNTGLAYSKIAEWEMTHGNDPVPAFEKAIEAYERAGEVNPDHVVVHYNLGRLHSDLAYHARKHGRKPHEFVRRAAEAFDRALAVNPDSPYATHFHTALGGAFQIQAMHERETGADPRPTLARAIRAYEDAVAKSPDNVHAHFNLGLAHAFTAQHELDGGGDPRESAARAVLSTRKAIELNPDRYDAFNSLGRVHGILGRYELERDRDPAAELERGRRALNAALELNPTNAYSPYALGRQMILRARWEMARGGKPDRTFESAREHLEEAARRDPDDASTFVALAQLCRWRAEWNRGNGGDAHGDVETGLDMVRRALEANPNKAEAMALKGSLLLASADGTDAPDRPALLAEARQSMERAFALNPNLAVRYGPDAERAGALPARR